jgi:hypothetical protein
VGWRTDPKYRVADTTGMKTRLVLSEIYDSCNAAVERDYEQSIRWYEKAREGGEDIPPPKSHGNPFISPIRVAP